LVALLAEHIGELATSHDYRLLRIPTIVFNADSQIGSSQIIVDAANQVRPSQETASLNRVELPPDLPISAAGRLIINAERTVVLEETITNIGRSRDNDIVLSDPTVSRHHAQVRLRFGAFTLFDNDSQHGTFVNEVRIHEHRLQSGDVIRMGHVRMIYVEDSQEIDQSQTDIYSPLRP
jgi:pSer/pThr/pTyr-binding forkhead associated (FHA) protein